MSDKLEIEGILRIREIPQEWDTETFKYWWARMTEREKERRTLWEGKNLITNQGRNLILGYLLVSASASPFSLYFSVGTGTIYVVQPSDTTIASELARTAVASINIVGNTATSSSTFNTGQANGTWTNAGMWGVGASGTLGSGQLSSHLLCNFTKTSATAITCDYSITLM